MKSPVDNPYLKEIIIKMMSFCAYRERAPEEVRLKMKKYKLSREQCDEILEYLNKESFLNEERFAKTYAGSKFRVKGWGRLKILNGLRQKGISQNLAESAVYSEIEEADYLKTLRKHLAKKKKTLKNGLSFFEERQKVTAYALSKGFEWEEVQRELDR